MQTAGVPFVANFSVPGQIELRNLGSEDLVFDVRFAKYGTEGVNGEEYGNIVIKPGDTMRASPKSWDSVEGGKLVIQVDVGSDRTVDYEKEVNPRSAGGMTTSEEEQKPAGLSIPAKLPIKLTPTTLWGTALALLVLIALVAYTRRGKA